MHSSQPGSWASAPEKTVSELTLRSLLVFSGPGSILLLMFYLMWGNTRSGSCLPRGTDTGVSGPAGQLAAGCGSQWRTGGRHAWEYSSCTPCICHGMRCGTEQTLSSESLWLCFTHSGCTKSWCLPSPPLPSLLSSAALQGAASS